VSALLDARGCLNDAGFAALEAAPPGRGPADAAAHLAGCGRCQRRFLARGDVNAGAIRAVPGTAQPPPLWRTLLVVAAAVLLIAAALATMRMLAG
jgi:hypothetical protein